VSPVSAQLPPQPWLEAAATQRVLAALAGDGTELRFVGGCVRDALLGRPVTDLDLATPDPPDLVLRKLSAAGLTGLPTGLAHGTVTALVDRQRFEVTTLRRDVETDGRHARVAFTDDWRADAARRDFTMNALSAGPDRAVHDYFGGIADLAAGVVRFVGDPAARLAEDHLRLLRFWRFHAHYGRGAPRAAERAACAAAAGNLARLSGERIRDEVLKLLAAPDPVPAIAAMAEDGILANLLPAAPAIAALAGLCRIDRSQPPDRLLRLIALLPPGLPDKDLAAFASRLRLSRADAARLAAGLCGERVPSDRRALRRELHAHGTGIMRDRVRLAAARAALIDAAALQAALATIDAWEAPRLPVTGADVLALGATPGRAVGAALSAVDAWWAAQDFAPDRAACLAELARIRARSRPAAGS
jgi:poly(A) polymerase